MSKRKRSKAKRQSSVWSVIIPVVVGVAVVAIVVGAILSSEKRRAAASVPTATLSVPIVTAQPQPTTEIPYPDVVRISVADAKALVDKGQAALYDVRTKESYDQSHAVGAISLPEAEVDAHLSELPRDKLIILYCT